MYSFKLAILWALFACPCALIQTTSGRADADRPSLLFVAGLEGTGHHFFDTVFRKAKLSFAKYATTLKGSWSQFGMMRSGKSWSREDLDENVKYLTELAKLNPGKLLYLYFAASSSYPNGQGTHHDRLANRQPDMVLLKEACDRAGVDLKVIVNVRQDADTLVATCKHRHDLERCENQSETLRANTDVMISQVSTLVTNASARGQASVKCARYGNLLELGEALATMVDDSDDQASSKKAVQDAWTGSEYHHDVQADDPSIVKLAETMHGPRLEKLCNDIEAADVSALLRHILPSAVKERRGFNQFMVDKPWRKMSD
jgi:hypothetical protein